MDKFGCCSTCLNNDGVGCEDCEDADGYELDEDLFGIQEDGRMGINRERLAA